MDHTDQHLNKSNSHAALWEPAEACDRRTTTVCGDIENYTYLAQKHSRATHQHTMLIQGLHVLMGSRAIDVQRVYMFLRAIDVR